MKKIFLKVILGSLLSTFVSCNYLDVSDEMVGGLSDISQVFNNVDRTKKWYGDVFAGRPDYSAVWVQSAGMGNPWTAHTDEIYTRLANNAGKYNDWNSANSNSHRWGDLYERIRQANIFLENARPIVGGSGANADRLTESEVDRYKANVRFMRAIYHYYLMELYGPVPILDRSLEQDEELNLERNSLDEVINFIDRELIEAMKGMEQNPYHTNQDYRAVPTKGTAMAYRAKLWVYAASKLFNGGYTEALSIKNKDGKRLFPDQDNGEKLDKAVDALAEFIEYAETGAKYALFRSITPNRPDLNVYEMFQEYNSEIIWATSTNAWGSTTSGAYDQYSTPRCEPNGLAATHVLQELVDDFYMADGFPTKATSFLPKSSTYTEEGFGTLNSVSVSNMYIGREPRFYNTVTFSGMKWHISGNEVQLYKGGNADNSAVDGVPLTGYYLYKRFNRTVHGSGAAGSVKSKYRPSIIFRLAEFYLLYAEMLNEKSPSNTDVLKYVNLVRDRAGLEKLEVLNPNIVGNKEMQREAIRRESRIELATEGQRYFDVRRWMIAENEPGEGGQGGEFTRMNVDADKTAFNKRRTLHTRSFKRKNYLYPIPKDEIQKSNVLVQNYGW